MQWLRKHMHSEILRRFHDIGTDTEDVIEFLVIRRPAPVTVSQGQAEAVSISYVIHHSYFMSFCLFYLFR